MKFQDYYSTLGVARNASADDIRSAYRKLARMTHPDVDKTSGAAERFKQINEAYEVLKEPATRQRYDALGENWKDGQDFTPPPDFSHSANGAPRGRRQRSARTAREAEGFSSFFESLFGDRFAHMDGGGFDDGSPMPGPSIEATLPITLEDAISGAKRTIRLGSDDSRSQRTIDVTIPAGTTHGSTMRLRGLGEPGRDGAGDLLLHVEIAPHPRFKVDGHDLHTRLAIRPFEAALGARVPLATPEGGEVRVTITPGSSSGKTLRLRGLGLKKRDGARGDLLVQLDIVVPETLSDDERKLYEELARLGRPAPGAAN